MIDTGQSEDASYKITRLGGESVGVSEKKERMSEMTSQAASIQALASRWSWLWKIGEVVALITGTLLLIGVIGLIITILQPSLENGWLSILQNNWLIKIFTLHADFRGAHADLYGLNYLDVVLLLLVSIIFLSLSTTFRNTRKVLSLVAFALSVIAIILFLATRIAGRSTVMLAVLINSLVMLRDKTFPKAIIYLGILASVLLFVGDLTVGIHSNIITILFGIGYVLLTIWFFLIAQTLFRLAHMS